MGLGDIRYEDVIAATEEFRRLGRDDFLRKYGFKRARSYELVLDGLRYDSKAIAGVAHGHATGEFLRAGDFSGGAATVARCLRELGFVVENGETPLDRAALLERLRKLKVSRGPGSSDPSRHQPLSLLWAISRAADERPRMTPWPQFRDEVGPLLVEFGLPNAKATPEYPFWHLRGSGLWEVQGIPAESAERMPKVSLLDAHHPQAGFSEEAAALLRDPVTRLATLTTICETYLQDVDRQALFERIGLDGYTTAGSLLNPSEGESGDTGMDDEHGRATGPAPRRAATRSVIVRDEALARKVKELEGDRCQICDTALRYLNRPYSEAAHIRGLGRPHHGPDELHNLLCLCANCHVLFDGLEIYIDPDGLVRGTRDDREPRRLRRAPGHPIDEAHLDYHRDLCTLNARKPAVD
ncbi:HNH endonuclease [Streptomyces sp. NRRL S-37]|uniref:HNH endonuclease n=1 Tax=Streptomyces sp. NRRL S-37 TaxID=1463903 RepID=UPI000A7FB78C|nr:HNH endonuclease [Streptomyces sp. NRRL S-37]